MEHYYFVDDGLMKLLKKDLDVFFWSRVLVFCRCQTTSSGGPARVPTEVEGLSLECDCRSICSDKLELITSPALKSVGLEQLI